MDESSKMLPVCQGMTNASRQIRRRKSPVSRTLIRLLFAVAVPLIGCTHDLTRVYGVSGASPHPETAWTPPKQAIQDQNSLLRRTRHPAEMFPQFLGHGQ